MNIDNPVESAYGIQSHLTFGGTGDASTETIALSAQIAGTAAAGTGYHWGVKSDLRAVNTPSGAGNTSAAFFGVATVDACDLFYGEVLATKTVDKGLYLHGAGTITNGVSFAGTVTNAFDFASDDGTNGAKVADFAGAITVDDADAAIKIDINGTAYYIPAFVAGDVSSSW